MARIRCLDKADVSGRMAEIFDEIAARRDGVPNLHRTLAGSPKVFEARIAYSNALRHDIKLSQAYRELSIMLVARLTKADYEYAHHWKAAVKAGVTKEQLAAIEQWKASPLFNERERAVLRYAEEATLNISVSDDAWSGIKAFLDEQELIDLVLIVAWYNQTSRVLIPLQIELEKGYTAEGGYQKA